jgi:hypothetical protein
VPVLSVMEGGAILYSTNKTGRVSEGRDDNGKLVGVHSRFGFRNPVKKLLYG